MTLRARAWFALALPPVSWFAFEVGLGFVQRTHCDVVPLGLPWGLAAWAGCALAIWLAGRPQPPFAPPADRWLARLPLVVATFFALAIGFQLLALLIVPPCVG